MSDFIKHIPCNNCGSRDNRALYKGGSSYCFGCGVFTSGSVSPYILEEVNEQETKEIHLDLPPDTCKEYGKEATEWANKYDISVSDLLARDVCYSPSREQLIFCWYAGDVFRGEGSQDRSFAKTLGGNDGRGNQTQDTLLLWQARNFSPSAKSKCYTRGNLETCLPIYYAKELGRRNSLLVLVEDPLSAIKVARQVDCMPCLGSTLSKAKLSRLARFYDRIDVWLDGDMFHNALKMSCQLGYLGVESSPVYTPKDPKEYSDIEIASILKLDVV